MPTVVHMDIPTDNVERARNFYSDLFGWEFSKAGDMEYYLIRTRGLNGKRASAEEWDSEERLIRGS
ncbi:VOC family protein [Methanolobus chelungpuianus]|uniref:VOC family protein n=1 Tax=Methanolobus chelungpuianus TaxID=502115 RepID=UPI0021156B09|nr:VOC family protein [Methanolobus chelungpuianus]